MHGEIQIPTHLQNTKAEVIEHSKNLTIVSYYKRSNRFFYFVTAEVMKSNELAKTGRVLLLVLDDALDEARMDQDPIKLMTLTETTINVVCLQPLASQSLNSAI